ncbi:MAG: hypothetical protein HYZ44_04030 [Bacteroidetes bacterium]|nr:hypothetical protein [Bacteroidota bacterium]
MKKLSLLILCFIMISCGNDVLFQMDSKMLVSIDVKSYYTDISGQEKYFSSHQLTIDGDKLIKIVTNTGHQDLEYIDQNVSKRLEYNLNGELISDTRYYYDNLGRITGIVKNGLGESPYTIINETRYENNQVIVNWKNAWGYFTNFTSTYLLNSRNEVENEELLFPDGTIFDTHHYTYSGSNLKNCFRKRMNSSLSHVEDTLSFEYVNIPRKIYFKRFMFGANWRLNSLIENSVDFSSVSSDFKLLSVDPETSDQLILRYGNEKVNVNYDYTFDEQGDVRSEVRMTNFPDGQKYKTITTYTYSFALR